MIQKNVCIMYICYCKAPFIKHQYCFYIIRLSLVDQKIILFIQFQAVLIFFIDSTNYIIETDNL